jgi:hypothetical protein
MKIRAMFGAMVAAAVAGSASGQNLMVNGSFETPGPGFVLFQGWQNFNNVFLDDNSGLPGQDEVAAQDGADAAKMFGFFSGMQNDHVLLQTVTGITPGETYTLSTYALHRAADQLQTGNLILLQMVFQNASGTNLEVIETPALQPGVTPTDVWTLTEVSGIAPPGTTQILVALLHLQLDGVAGGASFWDNVQLVAGADEPCIADVTGDGQVDSGDLALFIQEFLKGNCD